MALCRGVWHVCRRLRPAALILGAASIVGCAEAPLSTHEHLARANAELAAFDLELVAAPAVIADLRYQAPAAACAWVYEIASSYEPAQAQEPNTISHLALGPAPRGSGDQPPEGLPIPPGAYFSGRLYYRGIRAEKRGVARDVYLSGLHAGPTAPTAGCLPQTWDPIEDAMTLGWPKLTGRITAVEEAWTGLRVAGKCNRSACVDPKTGGGGPENHERTCITMDWQNEFAGIYTIGAEHFALVRSLWSDGHGPPEPSNKEGIWSERTSLVALTSGRPVWSRAKIHHNFPRPTADKKNGAWAPVVRTWEMTSIDECAGSMSSLGWERPPATVEVAAVTLASLADADELAKSQKKSPKRGATRELAEGGAPSE